MKKTIFILAICFFISAQAFAHVTNEKTLYSDIGTSKAAAEILLLDTLGIVSAEDGAQEFRPADFLKTAELEEWMAGYPYEKNDIPSGSAEWATYDLVDYVLFNGGLNPADPGKTITREEFAVFVAAHAEEQIEAENLIARSGFATGPVGEITAVKKTEAGHVLNIEGQSYALGLHPRVDSEILDPAVWKGLKLERSLLGPERADGQSKDGEAGQQTAIQYAVIVEAEAEQEPAMEKEAGKALVKEGLDEEAGKVNGLTVIALLSVALLIYWINRKKKQDIE